MRDHRKPVRAAVLLAVSLLALGSLSKAQADFTLEASPPLSSLNVPAALADRLQTTGSRLVRTAGGGNVPVCDIWWVKAAVAKKPGAKASGVLYGEIQTGALVGLLRFLTSDAEDSRDQKLKPGFYTMRYAQLPPDSSEAGSSQYLDFLLLSAMGADSEVTKTLSFEEASRLSSRATGTGHPALMSLVPVNPAYKRLPAVVADDVGNCAVQVNLREESETGSRDVELAILLLTPPKEQGGS
ncbi:MAG TPA: hypothetical protein VG860_15600 [Terriglobia bacterium]|jgi:hypothetical protein|nr:hypothetical protein [Terriglobia bacterium]